MKSVYAQMGTHVHGERTRGEDNAILILEFENGVTALAEENWTKLGGMDDRAEVHGSKGVAYADLLHGNAIETYSAYGYDYPVEKGGQRWDGRSACTRRRGTTASPQEMEHFVECVLHDRQPLVTGEDGRAVLEVLFAAYASAGSGRKVALPFESDAPKPFDLWKPAHEGPSRRGVACNPCGGRHISARRARSREKPTRGAGAGIRRDRRMNTHQVPLRGVDRYYIEDETMNPFPAIAQSVRFLETVRF